MSFETERVSEDLENYKNTAWKRFKFNVLNLKSNEENPYHEKMRPARQDLGHSYVNLFVEGWRATAYLVGHLLAALFPFAVLAIGHGIVSAVAGTL